VPTSMHAVRIHKPGGSDALTDDVIAVPDVAADQVLVKVAYSGVNFIDTYQRSGLYKLPMPAILGREASGVVVKVGSSVQNLKVGSRVAVQGEATYAEYSVQPAARVIPVPDATSLADAAASLLQGMTAHYLVNDTFKVKQGDNVLIHAGAGGTGQLLIQMCKTKGARVLVTVGSKDKEAIVRALGADVVINYSSEDFEAAVKKATDGKGVSVVYDGVGAATWQKSLKSLALLGHLVLFGNASGKVPPVDPLDLSNQGSITLTRPVLGHYTSTPQILQARAADVFAAIAQKKLAIAIGKVFPLAQTRQAHDYLESRASTGKILVAVNADLK